MAEPIEAAANSNGLKYDDVPGKDKGYKVIFDSSFDR